MMWRDNGLIWRTERVHFRHKSTIRVSNGCLKDVCVTVSKRYGNLWVI